MWKLLALLVAVAAGVGLLVASASANNDPHRVYMAAAPFTLDASFCGFPVAVTVPVDNEYAKVLTLPDGSTMYTFTGSFVASLTNTNTTETITVNVSGPGTQIFSPDFTAMTASLTGRTLLYMENGPQFGFPSNLVLTTGLLQETVDLTTSTLTSVAVRPHVLLDVCAALAP
jgi:hypothetical protein